MGTKSKKEKTALTPQGVDKAIDSFKQLHKDLKIDYQKCIDLIKELGKVNIDQNFYKFQKKFNPKQKEVNNIADNMGKQLEFSEKMKKVLKKFMNEEFGG